nr:thiopurine S-methyltransferase [Desulfuromonadales bacterium]
MDRDFWKTRWQQNEIGFHMEERHDYLPQFYHRLHVGPGVVFVPLCGKSPDLIWLRQQGARVLGVELSEIAVADFFSENGLDVAVDTRGSFRRYHADSMTLLCGDLFDLQPGCMDGVRGVYDRGSLVALPPSMRRTYAQHLCRILPVDCRILLVSYEYDQSLIDGPPFSVPMNEIEQLFDSDFSVELLAEQDA